MKTTRNIALLCSTLLLLGGCGLFGGSSSESAEAAAEAPAAKAEAAKPAVKAETKAKAKASKKSSKASASTAAVQADLDIAAKDLVGRASRTVVPSRTKPNVTKSGKKVIVTFTDIDTSRVHTTLRPGSSAATPYTGIVSYTEDRMRCTGATKSEALSAKGQCQKISSKNIQELIRYDGKKWNF